MASCQTNHKTTENNMKKIFKYTFVLGLATLALASCSEPDDEITSVSFSRNFSPVGIEASVRNKTNVLLTWAAVEGATSYNIEVFANDSLTFSGTPAKTISDVVSSPYTVTGLEGETNYSFRIQAVTEGDPSRDSKWIGVFAKTEAEQIMYSVAAEDIKATSVTLRWPAGESASTLTLTAGDNTINYNVTAADIAAGAATITGLTPETSYKAVLIGSTGKTRGSASFKTGVELADTDILVQAGQDLAEAVANAPEGYRLVLEPGTYGIAKGGDAPADHGGTLKITKKLAIKGLRQNDHPVIQGRIEVQADFDIDQVTLDGTDTDGGQCFNFTGEANLDHLNVTNSEIKNYVKGFFYLNVAIVVNTINIEGCVISNIECSGGDFFDSRKGGYNAFNLKNNTIYECAKERDIFRMDDASSAVSAAPVITVDHNTFYNVGSGGANYRVFYVRFAGNTITFTNNLVVGTNYKRGFANQKSTDQEPTLDGNCYFNTENLIEAGATADASISWFDSKGITFDPQFANAAGGNFTIGNEDLKSKKIGDPRWY